jgi:DNA polymerase-3 subunit delta
VAWLQDAVLACRRADPDLAHAQAQAIFLRIAVEAARRRA